MDEAARENGRLQLLEGLNVIYEYLRQISDLAAQRVRLSGSFRGYQETIQLLDDPKQRRHVDMAEWRTRITLFIMVLSITLYFTCAARYLIFFNMEQALPYLACAGFLIVTMWKKTKWIVIVKIILCLGLLWAVPAELHMAKLYIDLIFGPGYGVVLGVLFVLAIVISIFVARAIFRKENRDVDRDNEARAAEVAAKNREITAQNKRIIAQNKANETYNLQLCDQIAALDQQIAELVQATQEYGAGWYPPRYYNLYAVEQFIEEVVNFRAYSNQEMVNIFEQSEHWKREESGQQQIMAQLGQIHFGLGQINQNLGQIQRSQNQIIGQLQFADALRIQKMFQDQWNVEELKQTIRLSHPSHYYVEIKR